MGSLIQIMRNQTIRNDLFFACSEAVREAKDDFALLGAFETSLMKMENVAKGIHNPMAPPLTSLWTIEKIGEKAFQLETEYKAAVSSNPYFDKMRKIALCVFCAIGLTTLFFVPWVALGFGVAAAALLSYDIYVTVCRMVHANRYRKIVDEFANQWVSFGKALYASGPQATWGHFLEQQLSSQKGGALGGRVDMKGAPILDQMKDPAHYYYNYVKHAFEFLSEQKAIYDSSKNLASLDAICAEAKRKDPIGFAMIIQSLLSGRSSQGADALFCIAYKEATEKKPSFFGSWFTPESKEVILDDELQSKPVFSEVSEER